MPRSKILRGVNKQLDRAQHRGRSDHKKNHNQDPSECIIPQDWLYDNIPTENIAQIETLNITWFLHETQDIKFPAEERLRKLAIYFENNLYWNLSTLRTWLAVDRIYLAAIKLNNNYTWIHHSRAITAHEFSEVIDCQTREKWKASPKRRQMMQTAYQSANKALLLDPNEVRVLYIMGLLYYFDPDHLPAEALEYYQKALEIDSQDGWSALYRAHCLHDMEQWSEAAIAYGEVSPAFFVGPRTWRYEYLLEQRAYCGFRAGRIEKALVEFESLLTRWEKNSHLLEKAYGAHITEAAQGPLGEILLERTNVLFNREDNE